MGVFATFAALALAPLPACSSTAPRTETVAAAAPRLLTDEERRAQVESFDDVWQTIRDGHFDPKLNGADWDAAKLELRPHVETAQTANDARAAISELIAKLKQTHFGLIPSDAYEHVATTESSAKSPDAPASSSSTHAPTTSPTAEPPKPDSSSSTDPGESGVQVRVVDGRALVTKVRADTPAYSAGVRPGWIIDAIDNRPVAPSLKLTEHAAGSAALGLAMTERALQSRLDGPVGSTVPVRFIDGQDKPVTLALQRAAPAGSPATVANLPTMFVEFESRRLPENIGYMALSIFLDPPKINPLFDKAVKDFADTDGIVLDLRGNPGGLGFMATAFGGYFVDEPNLKLGTMRTRALTLNFVLNPRATPYLKPLAILVDECSLSTSEILAGGLQDLKRARIFGTPTGGAALPSVIKPLPSGDALQYAVANYVSASGRQLEGEGVIPDQIVPPSREALLAGDDPALTAAVRWIQSERKR